MKTILLILLMLLANIVFSSPIDTAKLSLNKSNSIPKLAIQLLKSFEEADFERLEEYSRININVVTLTNTDTSVVKQDACELYLFLSLYFQTYNYHSFKIEGKTVNKVNGYTVKLYDDNMNKLCEIFFILDDEFLIKIIGMDFT